MRLRRLDQGGFTLVELMIVIIVAGILSAVAISNMSGTVETAKYEQTKKELDALAVAIAGNPSTYGGGTQADFGYVGDIGALPASLDNLMTNPGYGTWKGPYLSSASSATDFKEDGWGVGYVYSDTLLRSTGSGGNIDKIFAPSRAALLSNAVEGVVLDVAGAAPGSYLKDSIRVQLLYPNGAGAVRIDSVTPNKNGWFGFANVPVGRQTIRAIFRPSADAVTLSVDVYPRRTAKVSVVFPADLW